MISSPCLTRANTFDVSRLRTRIDTSPTHETYYNGGLLTMAFTLVELGKTTAIVFACNCPDSNPFSDRLANECGPQLEFAVNPQHTSKPR